MASTLGDIKEVIGLGSNVVNLGKDVYRRSDALEEFKSKIESSKRNYESWQQIFRDYSLSSDHRLRSVLQEAKEQLRCEEERLKRLDRGCLCLFLTCGINFPEQLGKSIVDLDSAILASWKAEKDGKAAARERAELSARAPKFGFGRDLSYVRIPAVEEELKKILNTEGGGNDVVRVVLLHGRAGTGKSSMARNLALDYLGATSHADASASSSSHGCREFDNVFYLDCESAADSKAKLADLRRQVDWDMSAGGSGDIYKDPDMDKTMLKQLLRERCSLIILDDVWDEGFLQDMVSVCSGKMTMLVTSQKMDLCDDAWVKATKVSIDNIDHDDSVRILKKYAGFMPDDEVLEPVKEYMDYLVKKVGGHPHALASIGVVIHKRHNTELQQWQDVTREYDQHLRNALGARMKRPPNAGKYEWMSVAGAIQVKFNRLGEEERMLLALLFMLEEFSTAEEILRLFYGELTTLVNPEGVRSSTAFSDARNHLENYLCIKTYESDDSQYIPFDGARLTFSTDKRARGLRWAMHSLDRQFIKDTMGNDINKVLNRVNSLPNKIQGLEPELQVHATKLMGKFFKSEWAKEITVPKAKSSEANSGDMLPIVRLMAENVGRGWDTTLQNSADQIFLSFMSEGLIHKNALKKLLRSSTSKCQTWSWIVSLSYPDVQKVRRLWSTDEDLIVSILSNLGQWDFNIGSTDAASLDFEQCKALVVLLQILSKDAKYHIFRMRKLVLGLFQIFESPNCPEDLKDFVAVIFSYLVPLMQDSPFEYGRERSAITQSIVKRLVRCFHTYVNRSCRQTVTLPPVRLILADVRTPIDRLGQHRAGLALLDLVCHSNSDVNQDLINNGFRELVDILGDKNADATSQALAGEVLGHLCDNQPEISVGVSNIKNLSDCLAKLIESPEERSVYIMFRPDEVLEHGVIRFSDVRPRAVGQLMRIDPARGSGMDLRSSDQLGARGLELMRVGRHQDALMDLQKAQLLEPECFKFFDELRRARIKLNDWEGALGDCDEEERRLGTAESSEEWSQFYLKRSRIKHGMENLSGALEDLDKSLQSNRNNFVAVIERGEVKYFMGDKEDAEAAAKQEVKGEALWFGSERVDSLCVIPNWAIISHRIALKRLLRDFPGALEDINKSLQIFPYDYRGIVSRGEVKLCLGDEDGARADAEDDSAEADVQEEIFRLGFKPKEEAFRFGFKARKEARRLGYSGDYLISLDYWVAFYQARGALKHMLGNLRGALHDLDKCLQLDPNDYEVLKKRSSIRLLMGDLPGALEDINKSLQLFPYDYLEILRRGAVNFHLGDVEKARADAEDDSAEADVQEEIFRLGSEPKEEAFQFGLKAKKEARRLGYSGDYLNSLHYWGLFYQERGVLKRLVGDLHGALDDLDKSLQLGPNDYEVLKQRGCVKCLMGDEKGARVDAENALQFRPSQADLQGYGNSCLGTSIVDFLDFRL